MSSTACSGGAETPPLRYTYPGKPSPVDTERMRDIARVVIAERLRRWHADDELQLQYSVKEYVGFSTVAEWRAWKATAAVPVRLALMWGREKNPEIPPE